MEIWLSTLLISIVTAGITLGSVVLLLRRQRKRLEKIVADFASHNVTMARRLTEIMLGQQKKQEIHEEALEKMAGYAMKLRKEINLLAIRSMDEDEDIGVTDHNTDKRLN